MFLKILCESRHWKRFAQHSTAFRAYLLFFLVFKFWRKIVQTKDCRENSDPWKFLCPPFSANAFHCEVLIELKLCTGFVLGSFFFSIGVWCVKRKFLFVEINNLMEGLTVEKMEGGNLGDDDLKEGRLEKCKEGQTNCDYEGLDDHGEDMAVLDFDVLCATVAMQSEHFSFDCTRLSEREGGGGVQRMWEGGLMDCCDDHKILLETTCCPSSTFGKNMRRAGFGTCIAQGTAHFLSGLSVLANFIAFGVTKVHTFLYVAIIIMLSMAAYAGYFRTEMRRRFNIKGSDSALDDCMHHLLCSSCSLCQEARTLEINNVQDGVWHGRGDTILVGSYRDSQKPSVELQQPSVVTVSPETCCMDKTEHAWSKLSDQSEPFVGLKHDSFL